MDGNADEVDNHTHTEKAARYKPKNTQNDACGIPLRHAVKTAENTVRKKDEQKRCDER